MPKTVPQSTPSTDAAQRWRQPLDFGSRFKNSKARKAFRQAKKAAAKHSVVIVGKSPEV